MFITNNMTLYLSIGNWSYEQLDYEDIYVVNCLIKIHPQFQIYGLISWLQEPILFFKVLNRFEGCSYPKIFLFEGVNVFVMINFI